MARFILALLVLVAAVYCEDKVHFHGDQVLRITPKNADEVKMLESMQENDLLDFWTEIASEGAHTDVRVPSAKLDAIKEELSTFGVSFDVIVEDLQKDIDIESAEMKASTFANGFNYLTYNRLASIQAEVRRLNSAHSGHTELFNVGKSSEGRDMIGLKVSSGSDGNKKVIWIDGCIHAREWLSCSSVMFFLKQLLEPEPAFRDKVTTALSKYDFYILPVFNVDGYEFSHTNNRMWRKTRSAGSYCRGADPNRNWDSHFGGAGTSGNPCSDIYRGPRAFSEPEVAHVANKLKTLAASVGVEAYWNIHCYSQLVLYPWGYTSTPSRDDAEMNRVGTSFASGVRAINGKHFQPGQPSRILYSVGGGSMDWTYSTLGVVYSYAPELRPGRSYRGNGFIMPASNIQPSGMEFTNGMLDAVAAMR